MKTSLLKTLSFMVLATTAGYLGGRLGSSSNEDGLQGSFTSIHSKERVQAVENHASYDPLLSNVPNFVEASTRSTAAVVYIKTTSNVPQRSFNDWFFGDIFGTPQNQQVINSGSGVIVSSDGYIVTNNHVVEKAIKTEVILANKESYPAKLIGTDPSTDLALLKIEAKGLAIVPFSNSNDLHVGEWVLAVGNPFNLTSTVTAGIVSAKGRNLNLLNNMFPIESFIQTDAAINPGNSGGALVNVEGALVGINTAILSRTGAYNGYGFAIPSNIVQKIIKDLKDYGSVQRAFLGADVIDLNASIRDKAKLNSFDGVYVSNIASYGPAKDAGILEGDVITECNGVIVNSKAEFDEQLSYYRPGDKINLVYYRKGKPKELVIKLTNTEGNFEVIKNESIRSAKLGADFEPIGKFERDRLGIESGIRIYNIDQGYIRRIGIREGFIVTHINKVRIDSAEQCIDLIENMRGQVSIEGVDKTGRKAFYSFFSQ